MATTMLENTPPVMSRPSPAEVALGELLGVLGFQLVVATSTRRQAAELPAVQLDGEVEGVADVGAIAAFGPDSVLMSRSSPCRQPAPPGRSRKR